MGTVPKCLVSDRDIVDNGIGLSTISPSQELRIWLLAVVLTCMLWLLLLPNVADAATVIVTCYNS
jgi:hypothetical protein